ncbi:MAG: GreA/GreB family elongation factor, partial [Candidatus Pacebacteria bacterium]|nr:GreA/GreB family elongation factor [Candidatus Paceibacterota bacterium]
SNGDEDTYYVLGLWDSDPSRKMISYATPVGKALWAKKEGDTVIMPSGDTAAIRDIRRLPEDMIAELNGD